MHHCCCNNNNYILSLSSRKLVILIRIKRYEFRESDLLSLKQNLGSWRLSVFVELGYTKCIMASNTGKFCGVPPDEVVAGSVVSVKTVLGDDYKGEVFAFDSNAGVLILRKYAIRPITSLPKNDDQMVPALWILNKLMINGLYTNLTFSPLSPHT